MNRPNSLWIVSLVAVILATAWVQPASAQTIPKAERVEFNKLVGQRNRLVIKLDRLDAKAAQLMKQGLDATVIHAEQVSVQDKLDLVELRLSILATRHGVAVPAPPSPEPLSSGPGAASDTDRKIDRAFARGRHRAVDLLRDDCKRMLSSIDFRAFLEQ